MSTAQNMIDLNATDLDYLAEVARDLPPLLTLDDCRCGCHGDYADHSMRAGESGRNSSEIVK